MPDVPRGPHRPHRFDEHKYEEPGQAVFFSAATFRRRPILLRPGVPELLGEAMTEAAVAHACALIAWCIMPDHLHYLACVVEDGGSVRRMADWLKRVSGFRISRLGFSAAVWQRSFWDRHRREHQSPADAVAYIMNNPVVEGLCERAEDWPYSAFLGYPCDRGLRDENGRRI